MVWVKDLQFCWHPSALSCMFSHCMYRLFRGVRWSRSLACSVCFRAQNESHTFDITRTRCPQRGWNKSCFVEHQLHEVNKPITHTQYLPRAPFTISRRRGKVLTLDEKRLNPDFLICTLCPEHSAELTESVGCNKAGTTPASSFYVHKIVKFTVSSETYCYWGSDLCFKTSSSN